MYSRKNTAVNGYLHTDGTLIKNEKGETVILRGWAFGAWMVPEGYMLSGVDAGFGFTSIGEKLVYNIRYDRGRTMNDTIREVCGSEYARSFWPRWYRSMVTEADVEELARQGYNSVRIPMDASTLLDEEPGIHFNEDTFRVIDDVLDWCEKYRIYAVLDLHGSVGGHSAVSCDNGLDNIPHMFQEKESWERTILLWEALAQRYADRWIVAGYELLNEPISPPSWHHLRPELHRFYDETIARIRKIDQKHMIFLQDTSFAHDSEVFDDRLDPQYHNWVMVFHGHEADPQLMAVTKWLEASKRLNVPVWFGEGSETQLADMAIFNDLCEDLGIGFNLFSWKAMDERTHIGKEAYTFPMPEGWDQMIGYIAEGGPRPGYAEGQRIFDALIENSRLEHCTMHRPDIHKYALRKQGIVLPAAAFDSRFKATDSYDASWPYGNVWNYRPEDPVKMPLRSGEPIPGMFRDPMSSDHAPQHLSVELKKGEHVCYTVYDIEKPLHVALKAQAEDGELEISFEREGARISEPQHLTICCGEEFRDYALKPVDQAPADSCRVKVTAVSGTVRIEKITLD